MRFISAAGLGDDVSVITHVVARHGGAVLWRHSVQSLPSDGTPAVVHATLLAETVLVGAPSGADEALFGRLEPAAGGPDTAGLLPPCSQGSWFTGAQGQGIAGVGGDFVRSETVFSDDLDAFGRLSSVRCLGPARRDPGQVHALAPLRVTPGCIPWGTVRAVCRFRAGGLSGGGFRRADARRRVRRCGLARGSLHHSL